MVKFIEREEGENIPVRISRYALTMLKKETGKSFEDIVKEQDLQLYDPLMFYAIESGHKALNQEMKIKDMKSNEWFNLAEDIFFKFVDLLPEFLPQLEEEGLIEKKSQPGTNRSQRREITRQEKKK